MNDEAPGVVADHWCIYWRDSGQHKYEIGHKGKAVCSGCGNKK